MKCPLPVANPFQRFTQSAVCFFFLIQSFKVVKATSFPGSLIVVRGESNMSVVGDIRTFSMVNKIQKKMAYKVVSRETNG